MFRANYFSRCRKIVLDTIPQSRYPAITGWVLDLATDGEGIMSERNYYLVSEGEAQELALEQAAEAEWDGNNAVLVYADDEREALGLAHLYDKGRVGLDNLSTPAGTLGVLRRENVPSNARGYVVYGETAIYGAGWTHDLAIEDARHYTDDWDGDLVDHREINRGGLALTEATAGLVIDVQANGGDLAWGWLSEGGDPHAVACLESDEA